MAIIGITASASTTAADADTADRVVFKTATLDAYEAIGFSPLAESIPFFMLGDFGGAPGSLHHGVLDITTVLQSYLNFATS